MATILHYTAFLAIILVHQSHVVTAPPPPYPNIPIFDACEEPGICGRGTCVHVSNSTVGFQCDCEPGWRQARPEEDELLEFLPCVIPNCTLNFTCTDSNHPPGDYGYQGRTNTSYLDPCSVTDCGGGSCNATSPFTRTCDCDVGYYNLLNSTVFPCYRRCAFGEDCPSLGYNTSTSIIDPNPFYHPYNRAASLMKSAEFACLITTATTIFRAVGKYI